MIDIKLKVHVADDKSQVILTTEAINGEDVETRSVFMPPVQAVAIANAILHAAEDCGAEVQVQMTPTLSPMQYQTLQRRTAIIMRSMNRSRPEYVAKQIVDTILSEVF